MIFFSFKSENNTLISPYNTYAFLWYSLATLLGEEEKKKDIIQFKYIETFPQTIAGSQIVLW
jgi:hypothetical protein